MADTGILTPQYVRIALPLASVGDRILAQLVDWLVLAAYIVAALWLISEVAVVRSDWLAALLLFAPVGFYTLFCEVFFRGQSLGKMALRIRVVMADGRQPTPGACLLRWLLWIVDGPTLSFPGLLVMVLSRRNQRLGDLAAATVVVRQHDYRRLRVATDEYDHLAHGYTPRYPAAADLTPGQADIVRRALEAPAAANAPQLSQLADKVQRRLGISTREGSPAQFLRRICSDYQYYALEEEE